MFASMPKSAKSIASDFAADARGAIAIIFGLSIFVLMLVTGLAIDIGRVMHAERSLAAAIDAAALAAAKGLRVSNLSDAEVQALAQRYFDANMQGTGASYANVQSFSVSVNRANNSVSIDVASEVPMIFANVGGISSIAVPKASVAIFDTKDIEIGLQLDVTGSMCMPCTKIDALKDAVAGADGLLDILMPDSGTTNSVRIGLAPFAAGVNAGTYTAAVTGGRTPADGCVYERLNIALQPTEASPAGAGRFKVRSEVPGATPCPRPENRVVAMTDSKSDLRSAVNGLSTDGATAGHLGAAWAWGLVSPEWSSIWGGTAPAPYNDGRTEKYVILMTDGDYNTVGGVMSNANQAVSNQHAANTCTAIKNNGVVVFTIGFQVSNAAKNRLRTCASGNNRFYDASNAQTLRDAFRAIADEINSLRLSS